MIRSLAAIAVGFVFIVAGYQLSEQLSPYPDGITVTGTVTGVNSGLDQEGQLLHNAVVTFTTQDGRKVSIESSSGSGSRPKIGTPAKVSYRPEAPEAGRVIPDHNWISILCYAIGGLVILMAFRSLFARRFAVADFLTRFRGPH